MDGVSGHRTRVADYEGWVGIRGVCGCLPCSLCILGHLCGSLDLISTRFECLGVIMFFWKDPPQTEGRRDAHPQIKKPPGCRRWFVQLALDSLLGVSYVLAAFQYWRILSDEVRVSAW